MWNQANIKKYIDAAGNSDVGGDDKLNFFLCGLMFEVKKSEIYYAEPDSTTSKNGHIFR